MLVLAPASPCGLFRRDNLLRLVTISTRNHRAVKHAPVILGAAVVVFATLGIGVAWAVHTDSMYPTRNASWTCVDGVRGSGFCQTDNSTLTVFRQSSVQTAMRDATTWSLNNSYNATDLNVSYPGTPSYTGDAETDIVYQGLTNLPTGLWGQAWCNDAVSSTRCDQHYVAFNNTMLARSSTTATMRRSLACHETGHAVGLTHGNNAYPAVSVDDPALACMIINGWPTNLGSHNVGQINAAY